MRKLLLPAAGVLSALLTVLAIAPVRADDQALTLGDDGVMPFFRFPDLPGQPGVRQAPMPGSRGASTAPGVTTPLVPPAPKEAVAPARSRSEVLDDLFERLAHAADREEASGLALRIQHVWLQSGSDTADLLMSRATGVIATGKSDVALQILDKIVVLDPDWVEAWNKRATLRYLNNDDYGSMEDILHVLALEPRHFGALSGMGVILERHGMKKQALEVLRKALAIYPHNGDLQKLVGDLEPDVEGRPI